MPRPRRRSSAPARFQDGVQPKKKARRMRDTGRAPRSAAVTSRWPSPRDSDRSPSLVLPATLAGGVATPSGPSSTAQPGTVGQSCASQPVSTVSDPTGRPTGPVPPPSVSQNASLSSPSSSASGQFAPTPSAPTTGLASLTGPPTPAERSGPLLPPARTSQRSPAAQTMPPVQTPQG